jgi:C4-dicarboxylate-specific signal transduction histidine kinase
MAATGSRFPEIDAAPSDGVASRRSAVAFCAYLALAALIALVDYETGYDVRLATLYLFPIGLAAWRLGPGAGTFMAVASTFAWLFSFQSLHPYTDDAYFYWEGVSKAATFLFIVWLVTQLRRALAHADQRFVTVLDGLAAAVFVESPRSEVLFANPRFRQKFGDVRPAMLPRDLAGDYAGEVQDAAAQRWYLVRSRPLRWVDGRPVTLRLVSDITEEKRVRELMERHRDALHRSARLVALGEFASAIAHEINQPLTAIATYNNTCLRLLEAGRGDPGELRQAMEKCRDQAKRAGAIIQRLRELLRHPTPAFEVQDLNAVARAAREASAPEAEEGGVTVDLALAPKLPAVRADALLIEQVLVNLVRNAIDAVQDLAPARRRVTIASTTNADGSVAVSVSDAGEGLRSDLRDQLFHPFVSDKPGGLGLGLSICRSVIESHGGEIRYEQGAPGARFAFTLPAAAA